MNCQKIVKIKLLIKMVLKNTIIRTSLSPYTMRFIILLSLFAFACAKPKYGNPDEWGPYFQGDIKLKEDRNGLINEAYRWSGGVVPYEFGSGFDSDANKEVVQTAMQSYDDLTGGCITFVPRTNEDDYIVFNAAEFSGCYSYVGMVGGEQEINYPQWCIDQYGSVQHEMLHALGFYHMQSSSDRDDYVIIHEENIDPDSIHNFDKYTAFQVSQFGYEYDYGSVMHYSKLAFSTNGEVTIETIDPAYQDVIGQRDGLSSTDIGKLMAMYNC